ASCTGSANQVYRVADKTTPEYYASNIALKNDSESACFSDPDANGKITMIDCAKGAKYNYVIDIRGYIKFINTKTGECIQPENYQNGAHLIEKPCTQLDYQWWSPIAAPGGWRIQNAQTKTCTRAPGLGNIAVTETCQDWAQSVITPVVDPYSGVTYTTDTNGFLNPVIPGTTANVGICTVQVKNTQVIGTVGLDQNGDSKCHFNYNGGDQEQPVGGKNYTVTVLDGTLWQAYKVGDKLPEYAIPAGFVDDTGKIKTVYVCRIKSNKKLNLSQSNTGLLGASGSIYWGEQTNGSSYTKFGWVTDQQTNGNYCNSQAMNQSDNDNYQPSAKEFEILVRRADKAYLLQLSDLKPGGTNAGKNPVLQSLASQKGLYENEKKVTDSSGSNQNGISQNNWKPDTGQYGGPAVLLLGDIVTLKGRVVGGNRNRSAIWKLPEHLAPEDTLLFSVNAERSSSQERPHLEIHSDGTIIPSENNYLYNKWIDLSGIHYSTSSTQLRVADKWNEGDRGFGDDYGMPTAAKVGKNIVLNGVIAVQDRDSGGLFGFQISNNDRGSNLAFLPDGFFPPKQLQFNVSVMMHGNSDLVPGVINISTNGVISIEGNSQSIFFINLSGITYEQ
ncbi:hypothetical protein WH96_20780, partial [Kiloniella spongiae]